MGLQRIDHLDCKAVLVQRTLQPEPVVATGLQSYGGGAIQRCQAFQQQPHPTGRSGEAQGTTDLAPVGAPETRFMAALATVDAHRDHGLTSHQLDGAVGVFPRQHQPPTASLVIGGRSKTEPQPAPG